MSVNAELQLQSYWDKRYQEEKPDEDFDWFRKYEDISRSLLSTFMPSFLSPNDSENFRDIIHELIPDKNRRILMLGCGNSTLTADMTKDGYTTIVNIDYSPVLISKMNTRYPDLDWRVGDVKELIENAEELGDFDIALDKGTMDALMAEKGSVWDPSPEVRESVRKEIDGVMHLLKARRGKFVYVTFGQPHFRKHLLEREEWEVESRELGDTWHYYLYVARFK